MEKDICCFRHDDASTTKNQLTVTVRKCRNGEDCKYLKQGRCNFHHSDREDRKTELYDDKQDINMEKKRRHRDTDEPEEEQEKKQSGRKLFDDRHSNFLEQRNRKWEKKKIEMEANPWSNFY